MDRATSLIFPGGRTLAGWWRQLSPVQPKELWIGYGYLHRIEATVTARGEQPLDSFAHLVLQAIALAESTGAVLGQLQQRLHLPAAALAPILAGMLRDGLLVQPAPDRWRVSANGQDALARQSFPILLQSRRVFPFLESLDAAGQRTGPPRFLPIAECPGVRWPVDDAYRFDVAWLRECVRQPDDWKTAHGFPLDVDSLAPVESLEPWQQVVIDRAERVLLALAAVESQGTQQFLGFAAKPDGWTLYDRAPVFRVPIAGDPWPQMTPSPAMHVWQDAWRGWCKQKQLPSNEVEICALNWRPPRLEVQAPPRLIQRLQAAKSDLFKGDAWLLVGDGYLRTAAQLAIKQNP